VEEPRGSVDAAAEGPAAAAEPAAAGPSVAEEPHRRTTAPRAGDRGSDSGELPVQLGRYEVTGELGRGGVGVVYEAWDPRLGRRIALKTLIAGRDASETEVRRFLREVRAAAHLRHPSIVPVHDAGSIAGRFYLAMDLIDGESLDARLTSGGPLPPRPAVELVAPIVGALAYAHDEGIVHRDVKPENILIDGRGRPYLSDFGLAQDVADPGRLTRTGQTVGTPAFMAPEQLKGEEVGPAADVYAVGATLYECLTGEVPFAHAPLPDLVHRILTADPTPLRALAPRIAPDLEAVVLACLEKRPERRYPSMRALGDDLARFLRGEAVRARSPSRARRLGRRLLRHRSLVAGAVVAALGLVGGVGYALWVRHDMARHERVRANLERDRARILALKGAAEARHAALAEAEVATSTAGRIAAYDRLLDEYPDAWEAHVARARHQRRLGRERRLRGADPAGAREAARRALADLRRARQLTPDPARRAPIRLLEAEVLRTDLADPAAAARVYARLADGADGVLAAYAAGRLALAAGRADEAEGLARRALARASDLAPGRVLLAEALLAQDRADGALEVLDRVAADPAAEAEVLLLRGRALHALGVREDALRDAHRAIELAPDRAAGHVLLGRLRLDLGQPAAAASSFERAARLEPPPPAALHHLAALYLGWGDLERAVAALARARGLPGADRDEQARLAEALVAAARAAGVDADRLEAIAALGG